MAAAGGVDGWRGSSIAAFAFFLPLLSNSGDLMTGSFQALITEFQIFYGFSGICPLTALSAVHIFSQMGTMVLIIDGSN